MQNKISMDSSIVRNMMNSIIDYVKYPHQVMSRISESRLILKYLHRTSICEE